MKVTCRGHVQKVVLYNKKTKIYRTIKGLIILFIKLQFSIRCNQAFRSLRTSTFNIYLNIYFNLNGLVICIICICIIFNTPYDSRHTYSRGLYTSNQNQVQVYVLVRPGGHWSTHQKAFVIFVTALTFLKTNLTSAQERKPSCV